MSVINLKSAIFYELLFICYGVRVDKKARLIKSESRIAVNGHLSYYKVYLKALRQAER